ncbi:hypothetical protein PAMP_021393 [Pampus punctatissimus]
MCVPGWPIMLLLFCLLDSATSSPISMYTPAPLPSQISSPSPFPTVIPSLQSPSLSNPHPTPTISSNSAETTENCPLIISPSSLVVRFGDPATANCSVMNTALNWHYNLLVWDVPLKSPQPTMDRFLVWSVDKMTVWNNTAMCFLTSVVGRGCFLYLSMIVYKPPDIVSIGFENHTGPMFEGDQYTLHCMVVDVALVGNLTVTFYRGQTVLDRQKSSYTEKTPVTKTFTLDINPSKDDDGVQYWCEAELELGAEGPQPPPVVVSEKLTAVVFYGPRFICPAKLQVREGESLRCKVRGNPKPSVTLFKDGGVVSLPTHLSRKHAGKYTVLVDGHRGQKNHTLEVEILAGSGTAQRCNIHLLLVVLLIQILTCCKTRSQRD